MMHSLHTFAKMTANITKLAIQVRYVKFLVYMAKRKNLSYPRQNILEHFAMCIIIDLL